MLESFGYVALFLIVAILFTLTTIVLPIVFRFLKLVPRKPTATKTSTFECGMQTIGKTWVQFNFRYYFYALLFIALDVLVVFLYPWAVDLRRLGVAGLVAVLVLISIVMVGYVYAWRKKVLEWK